MAKDLFSIALDARVEWALALVSATAGAASAARTHEQQATQHAVELGYAAWPDLALPNLIAGVPELMQRWNDGWAMRADRAWRESRRVPPVRN